MFNLVVPKHFCMNSNPEIIIDKSSDRFEEPSGGDVSVHTSHCADLQVIDLKSGGDVSVHTSYCIDLRMWSQMR